MQGSYQAVDASSEPWVKFCLRLNMSGLIYWLLLNYLNNTVSVYWWLNHGWSAGFIAFAALKVFLLYVLTDGGME